MDTIPKRAVQEKLVLCFFFKKNFLIKNKNKNKNKNS
jgi:hypothetical protein